MKLSANNRARILATVTGTATAESGIYGSKFFALLRCINMFGEPIKCEPEHKLNGLKALQIDNSQWIAVTRQVFKNGSSMCRFYLLEDNSVLLA